MGGYMPPSKSQVHITPQRVYDLIRDKWGWTKMFDPCPVNPKWDALLIDWKKQNYVNPPYAKDELTAFVEKAVWELENNEHESIMLLPCKTDQDWFHDIILKNDYEIFWIRKRLHFTNNRWASPAPNFLVKISSDEWDR